MKGNFREELWLDKQPVLQGISRREPDALFLYCKIQIDRHLDQNILFDKTHSLK